MLFGIQGSGKGTQAPMLIEADNFHYIGMGDALREILKQPTELGALVKSYVETGKMVPDDIVVKILQEEMRKAAAYGKNALLDGPVRNRNQQLAFDKMVEEENREVIAAVLELPEEVARERMKERGREDDTAESIEERIATYKGETEPLIEVYEARGRLARIDAMGTKKEVFGRLCHGINEVRSQFSKRADYSLSY